MAIINRNGRFYCYKTRREGGRVVSEYHGSGYLALAAERLDEEEAIR